LINIEGTDLRLSRWSYGTASLHHLPLASSRRRLLDMAASAGFRHFDTAPYYGYGVAECDLGRFLRGRRGKFTVATKIGVYPPVVRRSGLALWLRKGSEALHLSRSHPHADWRVDVAEQSLTDSLARLQTDYVDLLLLHEPSSDLLARDDLQRWMEGELARGRVRALGLAGSAAQLFRWASAGHALAQVLQVRDRLPGEATARFAVTARYPQITFGYLSGRSSDQVPRRSPEDFQVILRCNPRGSILVSTLRPERLGLFAAAAELEQCS